MEDVPTDSGGYLALFDGVITGEVRNPYTGKVHQRREIMEFYRSLMHLACNGPLDVRTLDMLEMVREFLDIPSDLHLNILIEVKNGSRGRPAPRIDEVLRKDMDYSLRKWLSEHEEHQRMVKDLFEDFKEEAAAGEFRSPSNGVLDHTGSTSLMKDMEDDDFDMGYDSILFGKGRELSQFRKRYVKP